MKIYNFFFLFLHFNNIFKPASSKVSNVSHPNFAQLSFFIAKLRTEAQFVAVEGISECIHQVVAVITLAKIGLEHCALCRLKLFFVKKTRFLIHAVKKSLAVTCFFELYKIFKEHSAIKHKFIFNSCFVHH